MSNEPVPSMNPFTDDTCQETIREIYLFLDGELTDEKRRVITAHLDQCQPCDDIKRFEETLRKVVQDRCKEQVPRALRDKIAQLINHELGTTRSDT
jgi:mycothiol system anti-sigma-R factor